MEIILLKEEGKDATVGVTEGTNVLRGRDLHLEKRTSDEQGHIPVIKRRKEGLYTDGGG